MITERSLGKAKSLNQQPFKTVMNMRNISNFNASETQSCSSGQ